MSVTIIAFAAVLHHQANRIVDFSPPAARLVNLAVPLGKCLGKEVVVSENLRDEVVAIYAPKVGASALMDALAYSLDAEWQERNGQLILTRSRTGELREKAREIKYRSARILARQKAMLAELERQGEFTPLVGRLVAEQIADMAKRGGFFNGNDAERMGRKTPLGRFIMRVIASLPAEQIATIPFAQRLVYSLSPTSRQRQLKVEPGVLDALRKECEAFAQAARGLEAGLDPGKVPAGWGPITIPTSIDLRLNLACSGENVGVTTTLFDHGKQLARSYVDIEPYEPLAPPSQDSDVKLELPPLAAEFREIYRSAAQREPTKISVELQTFMRRPDLYDPLSLVSGAAAKALSTSENKPVIYLPADETLYPLLGVTRGSASTLGMFRLLTAREEVTENSGFVVIRSKEPIIRRAERSDRRALASWLSSFAKNGPTTHDTMRLFAAHYESPGRFSMTWLSFLHPERYSPSAFRVFGLLPNLLVHLSKAEKEQLTERGGIPFAKLPPDAKRVTEQIIYGLNSRLSYEPVNGRSQNGETDASEVLPAGVPNDATWTAKRTVSSVLVGEYDSPSPGSLGMVDRGSQDIGFQMSCMRRAVTSPIKTWPTRFGVIELEQWYAELSLGPGITANEDFINLFSPVVRRVSFEDLPEPYKSQAADWADYYDKRPQETPPRMQEGAYGPPKG